MRDPAAFTKTLFEDWFVQIERAPVPTRKAVPNPVERLQELRRAANANLVRLNGGR